MSRINYFWILFNHHFLTKYLIFLCHSCHLNVFLKKHVKFGTNGQNFQSIWYFKNCIYVRIFMCKSFLGNRSWMYPRVRRDGTCIIFRRIPKCLGLNPKVLVYPRLWANRGYTQNLFYIIQSCVNINKMSTS
jgi:hypothetical protein